MFLVIKGFWDQFSPFWILLRTEITNLWYLCLSKNLKNFYSGRYMFFLRTKKKQEKIAFDNFCFILAQYYYRQYNFCIFRVGESILPTCWNYHSIQYLLELLIIEIIGSELSAPNPTMNKGQVISPQVFITLSINKKNTAPVLKSCPQVFA